MNKYEVLILVVAVIVAGRENSVEGSRDLSQVRQYFPRESEDALNAQLNVELSASYRYTALAMNFKKDTVALPGFAKLFGEAASEEREHAQKIMDYIVKRGGTVVFGDILKPESSEYDNPLDAVQVALEMEKIVTDKLMEVHRISAANNDPHLTDFIESEFLTEQVDSIKELGDLASRLRRVGFGVGVDIVDKDLQA